MHDFIFKKLYLNDSEGSTETKRRSQVKLIVRKVYFMGGLNLDTFFLGFWSECQTAIKLENC